MSDKIMTDYERLLQLQNCLVANATGETTDGVPYEQERRYFVNRADVKLLLPDFFVANRDLGQFWQFIKHKFGHYAERRAYIYNAFIPALDYLESVAGSPADIPISDMLRRFDEQGVHAVWSKALERRNDDPEGAITSAKTLLETVCKHILDDLKVEYDSKSIELHELYKLTAEKLNLSPEQHTADLFKKVLGSISGVVSGLGQIRNKLGDAHGKGKTYLKPSARHAEFVVNLSGTMALFIVRTFEERKTNGGG